MIMKKTIQITVLIFISLVSCKRTGSDSKNDFLAVYECPMHCEGSKTYNEKGICSVCGMDLELAEGKPEKMSEKDSFSDMSLFNVDSKWTNQDEEEIRFSDLQGDVLVMVMIYTSCKAACPRLVADMRNIEERLSPEAKGHVKMIFVSIDPETDTPQKLKAFAKENFMDHSPWMFLRSTEANTRELAAVVAVSYKEISPIDFSHSNIISVFDAGGEMIFQQEGLGVNSDNTVKQIEEAVNKLD